MLHSRFASTLLTVLFLLGVADLRAEEVPVNLTFRSGKKALVIMTPKAIRRITVEERTDEGWVPLLVKHLASPRRSELVVVQLPRLIAKNRLRALGFKTDRFPNLSGAADFAGSSAASSQPLSSQPMALTSVGTTSAGLTLNRADDLNGLATVTDPATVIESDIWKLVGSQLFFFNQYRGLQVLDLTRPEQPRRTGTLRMTARGELFFALDAMGERLALLGRSSGAGSKPSLSLVTVRKGVPSLDRTLDLGDGLVVDSRLVGNKLYLLTKESDIYNWWDSSYSRNPGRTRLLTIDVSSNAAASIIGEQEIPVQRGYYFGHALQIENGHVMVLIPESVSPSGYHWNATVSTVVHVFAIHPVTGMPVPRSVHPLRGFASDKFKCTMQNGHLVATSVTASRGNFATPDSQTWVQVFLPGSTGGQPLGEVELPSARGERLHATRYDGSRAYVVTFRNTDPLFIVDLSLPATPRLAGELEIPGWSTYLLSLGDRLLSVGVETSRVAVSLFDVRDPAAPTLLSRVYPGPSGFPSWSEANYDEKAVRYDPLTGKLLLPYQGWEADGYHSYTQEIDVGPDTLTLGRSIPHEGSARRGMVLGDHLVSVSGKELIVLDRLSGATEPVATLPLSWKVDQVLPVGRFLAQIEQGDISNFSGMMLFARLGPVLDQETFGIVRISSQQDPDEVLDQVKLTGGAIIGHAARGNRLFLAQHLRPADAEPELLTTILEVDAAGLLSQVTRISQKVPLDADHTLASACVQAIWPSAVQLVWQAPVQRQWGYWYPWETIGTITVLTPGTLSLNNTGSSGIRSTGTRETAGSDSSAKAPVTYLAAIDAATSAQPASGPHRLLHTPASNGVTNPAIGFAAGGFLFIGYQDSHSAVKNDGTSQWQERWWLQVVDARQQGKLVARHRTSVPGELLSIAQADAQGAVVLTKTFDWHWLGERYEHQVAIQASAYDGAAAYRLDEWSTACDYYFIPVAADGTRVFIAAPLTSIVNNGTVATTRTATDVKSLGFDPVNRKLGVQGTWSLPEPPGSYQLHATSGQLMASRWTHLDTATIGADGSLTPDASFDTPSSLWLPVQRAISGEGGVLFLPAFDYGVEILEPAP